MHGTVESKGIKKRRGIGIFKGNFQVSRAIKVYVQFFEMINF